MGCVARDGRGLARCGALSRGVDRFASEWLDPASAVSDAAGVSTKLLKDGAFMGRFLLGFKALFGAWFNAESAKKIATALSPASTEPVAVRLPEPKPVEPPKPAAPPKPKRSEALTLLATLQREARFIDFLKEPIESYADAQIGAAVRSIHRDSAAVVDRLFAIRPILNEAEGADVTVPAGADAARYRLTGKVTDKPHGAGKLVHHGWEATQCELPQWTGSDAAARVVAPAEVELT